MNSRTLLGVGATLIGMTATDMNASSPLDVLRQSNETLRRFTLDNGMVCLLKEDRSAPVMSIQIWVGTGAMHEGEDLGAGLSHYMEHMIFKGTATRGPTDITKQIDEAGGDINAYTSNDRTVFYADLPSRNWKVAVDVLSDAVMNASLPEAEWEKEKEVILREFAMGYDDPDRVMNKLLWDTAFRVHPFRVPVIGYEEVFRTMTRDHLEAFRDRHYVPDNMIVAIVGDIDASEVEAYLRNVFASFARKARSPVIVPQEPPQMAPREARKTGPYNVSRLQWAYHTVGLSHPDAPALDILAAIVGQGRSSRLVREVKENQKLVFDIDGWSYTPKDPGLFGISAVFDPARETEVIAAILAQVEAWPSTGFTDEEIAKAKRQMLVSELHSLQTSSGQASSYASGEFYAGNPRFSETYLARMEAVDDPTLRRVATTYLRPENRTLTILAPTQDVAAATTAEGMDPLAGLKKLTLSNGIPLIVREDHRLPFVNICAVVGGGLLAENELNNGVTQLMSDLLTRGTKARTSDEIAETMESLGASLAPFAGRNSFGIAAQGLSADASVVVETMADCLLNSVFPEAELAKQKEIQIASIRQQKEQPMYLAQESLRAQLFPGHPYRFTPTGNEASVSNLTRDAIIQHYESLVSASNVAISIFGDITADEARALAEKAFAEMPRRAVNNAARAPALPELPSRNVAYEPREQAIVLLGYPGIDLRDSRVDALSVLAKALSGLSSDLGIEIREKRGLVYYVGAFQLVGADPGFFALYAGTREDAAEEVEKLMREQLHRIAEQGLRDEEWKRAREQILAASDMSLQSNGELAQTCALNELYGLGYQYPFEIHNRMEAMTGDTIREAARSILKDEREAVSVVLPVKSQAEGE